MVNGIRCAQDTPAGLGWRSLAGRPGGVRCGDATPAPQAGDFTLVLLPDTQQLSRVYPEYFNSQTKWIADHQAELNIRYVLHLGDITDNNNELQWGRAKEALGTLDERCALRPGTRQP